MFAVLSENCTSMIWEDYNTTRVAAKISGVKHPCGLRFLPIHFSQSAMARGHHRTEMLGTGVLMGN